MDRSVEMRLRLDISNFMRNSGSAGREMDGLTARAAALDAAIDRIEGSSLRAAAGLHAARTQVRGLGRDSERAGVQIQTAQQRLDAWNASIANSQRGNASFQRTTRDTGTQIDSSGRQIDRFSGRIGLAIDGVLTLGSALVPIGAVAAQGAAGLAALGTAAIIGAGSAVLAFQGLADAVKKVQEYQDDPSLENLREAREELDKLSPAARQFAMEFQKTRPVFSQIQDAAAEGWFPGLTKALGEADKLAPKLEKLFLQSGQMGGALVAGNVESLTGPRWDEFFDFVADEAPSAMASLNRIIGDLGHGAAEMWMKLDPGNDSFVAWLEDAANGFDQWASSAEGAEDIEDFLAYARESGPLVADFLGSVGSALLDIVQAAAPLGGPTLQILTVVADVVGAIAGSDMATPILAGLAALRLFNRTAAVTTALQGRWAAAGGPAAGAAPMVRDPNAVGVGPMTQSQAAFVAAQNARAQAQARAAQRAAAMRAGAQGGALLGMAALSSSGMTENMESANTATMALLGTMVAPGWGTAAGAIVGGFMDIAGANDAMVDSFSKSEDLLSRMDFGLSPESLESSRKALEAYKTDIGSVGWSPVDQAQSYMSLGKGIFGDSDVEKAEKQYAALESQQHRNQVAAYDLGTALGMQIGPLDDSARSAEELQKALDAAKPAMDALGISQARLVAGATMEDWADGGSKVSPMMEAIGEAAVAAGAGSDDLNASIAQWIADSDSAAAKTENYRVVLRGLAEDEGTAAEQADRLREAIDALVDPALDAEEALSRQREVLKDISELNADGGFTVKNEIGRQNLATTRDYTKAVEERLATMVNAGRSEADVARALEVSREQFIQSGIAAGFSAKQMERRADAIGLTPALVETTFQALGLGPMERAVRDVKAELNSLPPKVRTDLITGGVPKSKAEAEALAKKYDLTARQRETLFRLVDRASGPARALSSVLDQAARDRQAIITITTRRTQGALGVGPERFNASGEPAADGATVPKTGLPYADRHLYLLADGEEIISNRTGQADQFRADRAAGRIPGYADGGTTGRRGAGGRDFSGVDFGPMHHFTIELEATTGKVKTFKQRLNEAERALDKETQKRDAARSLRESTGGTLSLADLFGGGLAGFDLALAANTNDTQAGAAALKKAESKGLDGALYQALAASGDLNALQDFAGLTRAQIAQREKQYASLERAQDKLGNAAVFEKYGESINDMSSDIRHLDKVTDRLEKTIKRLGRDVKDGAREGTREGARERDRITSQRARAGR